MSKLFKFDWALMIAVGLLLVIGFLALYSISFGDSASGAFTLQKQIISIGIGLVLMFFLAFFDYRMLSFYSTKLYFITLFLLSVVIFMGTTIHGTTGWIGFYAFHIQPVEIAKLVVIIFLASFLSKKKTQFSIAVRIIVSIVLVFIPIFLIMKQPDFGSASVVIVSWAVLLFFSGLNKKNLLILIMVGIVSVSSSWVFLKTYQKERIINFVKPRQDPTGSGYNALQAIIAVGSGRIWGKGLGYGSQSQLNFLPEKRTDFIFAVIAEELGFFGVATVFVLFGVIFWRMKEIARLASDNFGYLMAVGIITTLFFQLLINVGMNLGIMPVVGLPLPFLSYGGSSMVMTLSAVGIMQSIYRRRIRV